MGSHQPVWQHAPVWTLSHHQHGPHRQGVFFPPTAGVLHLSHGDIRVEGLWIAAWLIVGGVLAWWLPRRFFGQWHWTDVLPLACGLSLLPNETLTTTPNLSHSIGPLVLVLLAAHALLVDRVWVRWVLLGLIGPALTFTGFGLFAALVLLALGLLTALRRGPERWPATVATAMLTAGWVWFFFDYRFEPAAPGYQFPHFPLWDYGPFLMAMLSTPYRFTSPAQPGLMIGGMLLLLGGGALGRIEPIPPAAKLARLQSMHWSPFRSGRSPDQYRRHRPPGRRRDLHRPSRALILLRTAHGGPDPPVHRLRTARRIHLGLAKSDHLDRRVPWLGNGLRLDGRRS